MKLFINNNFNLHSSSKQYPTIDHKLSVLYGFINNISPLEIGSINNLCVTKRSLNSKKGRKTEIEFLIKNFSDLNQYSIK